MMTEYKNIPEELKSILKEIANKSPNLNEEALYNSIRNGTKVLIDFSTANSKNINILEEIKKLNP